MNLSKNETKGRFDDILGQTESFVKKVYDYFTGLFHDAFGFIAVCRFFTFVDHAKNLLKCCEKQTSK